uniref:Uncharacterized protein n=1 Tax=Tanacetum cinerariifolium TaxID=118510 RepID=A0A6L2LAR1_TANCI|nr:hypothetical protein [Tanacetum cinerariifolium]
MEHYPHLDNGIYNVVDRVMHPLALKHTRKPRSDSGKARHSVSSTFTHHNRGSSFRQRDEDDGASRASTPYPTTYLNSLKPLDYQQYDIPTSSEQDDDFLFERQTDLLNQTMHKELRAWDRVFKINDALGTKQYKSEDIQELFRQLLNDVQNIHEYINTPGWNRHAFYDDDDDDDVYYTIAITPVLSTKEPVDSLSMGDEHLDTIPATESDEVIKSSVQDLVPIPRSPRSATEIVIPEVEEIEDDNLRKKLLNVHLLIANIEALKDNPTPSSKLLTKSSSTSLKSFLEETNTFHNSLPEFEIFCFDLKEISSGSTTTHSDISLPDYEAFSFDDDHIEEISSGSTTTHSDISLSEYDSFVFDPSNDQFPPTDRSNFANEEFADELAHIISQPEYDCFYFWNLPDPGELISILNSGIHENLFTTRVNLPVEDDYSPLLAYVIWIFLTYLTYPVIPPYLHLFGNEDTIFDPGIIINRVYSFKPGLSHRSGTFKKFNTHRSHLNECPMIINGKNTPILDVLLFHFYPP